jgi:ribonuclease BN (tRNA processing enzyme)
VLGASAAAVAFGATAPVWAQPEPLSAERFVLLGTMGGPIASAERAMSSQAFMIGDDAYLFDCGPGVIGRLAGADIDLRSLRAIFVTHLHSDHVGDLGALLLVAWTSGLERPIDIFGPAPLRRVTSLLLDAFAPDLDARQRELERPSLRTLVHVHEYNEAGAVMSDANLCVRSELVEHGEMRPAFGYRIETARRTFAISGDTGPTQSLLRLAANADYFVAEAIYPEALRLRFAHLPNGEHLLDVLRSIHMSAADAGRFATEANVGALILTHLVPGDDPTITDAMWIAAARQYFSGSIYVGRDLWEC